MKKRFRSSQHVRLLTMCGSVLLTSVAASPLGCGSGGDDPREPLGVSHLYEVRNLATPLRSDLLSQARHSRWSVRRLQREIDARTSRPKRPTLPPILELLHHLADVPATLDLTPLAALSREDTGLYQAIADKLQHLVLRTQDALAKRVPAKESV